MKLVRTIINQAPRDWRAAAFLFERSWPNEYARTERIEQVNESADDKKISLNVYYDTGGQGIEKLTAHPLHPSMAMGYDSWKAAREKQRRLAEEMAATPAAPEAISDSESLDEEEIANYPPPQIVDKRLTGRIPEIARAC